MMTILDALILTARDLHEPNDSSNPEYSRGQANLIADACGIPSECADLIIAVITHKIGLHRFYADLHDAMENAIAEVRS